MKFLSYFDVLLAMGLIALMLYGLKKYSDQKKRQEERESAAKFFIRTDYRSEYRKRKHENRTLSFLVMPFLIAIIYIVLRANGTLSNPFL